MSNNDRDFQVGAAVTPPPPAVPWARFRSPLTPTGPRTRLQALKETALSQLKAKHARRSVVLKDADGQGVKVVDAKRLTKIGSVQLLDQLVPIQKHNAEVDMMEGVHARLTK